MRGWRRLQLCLLLGAATWPAAVLSQDCSFNEENGEVSTCDLVMDVAAFHRSPWKTGRGSSYLWQGGPKEDAQGSSSGGYGLATVTDMARKEAWMVTSPASTTGPEGSCVTFSFFMGQLGVESMKVLLITYDSDDPMQAITNTSIPLNFRPMTLWRRRQTTGGDWRRAAITYSTRQKHSIVFSASPDASYTRYRGFVAVDDIIFNAGPCENECLFDQDFCSWNNALDEDDFDWSLGWSSNKRGTGPAKDQASSLDPHVTTGGYAYIDSESPRLSGETARLVSDVLQPREEPLCFHFWVNMHGGGLGALRLLHMSTDEVNATTVLWQVNPDSTSGTDLWYACQQTVAIDQEIQLVLEASVGSVGAGDISLDSFRFTQGPCPSQPSGTSALWGDCTFVGGTCKWQVPGRSPYDCAFLSRVSGGHYDPPGHTESWFHFTDKYMKFDLNCYTNQPRDRAAMVSPKIKEDSGVFCLSFWVYMFTNVASQRHLGALQVVLMYPNKNVTVWRLQNKQHSHWNYAQVPVPVLSDPLQVGIEGVQGPKVMGMMGVDDITVFSSSQCSVVPASASVGEADCTFDHNFCHWKIEDHTADKPDSDTWHLPRDNRLIKDHTFNADGGGFAYLFSFRSKKESRISSPKLAENTPYCLSFWFSEIYEDEDAELSIARVREGEEEVVVWNIKQKELTDPPVSDQSPKWRYAQVLLESQPSEYQVVIHGKVYDSSWALDDITFFPDRTNCKLLPRKVQPVRDDA
ncbi:MAM and LDL-receptor class A domain-containing protein 1-like [Scylla paramamosain]|uniref:MAM and LDL-receptor class A domain-containing protein 1-like n=1 Tax=Scylla paramamosain TaxID=85552 RepID=UPI003083A582